MLKLLTFVLFGVVLSLPLHSDSTPASGDGLEIVITDIPTKLVGAQVEMSILEEVKPWTFESNGGVAGLISGNSFRSPVYQVALGKILPTRTKAFSNHLRVELFINIDANKNGTFEDTGVDMAAYIDHSILLLIPSSRSIVIRYSDLHVKGQR